MESANLHQLQDQLQLVGSSSSSSSSSTSCSSLDNNTDPSCYGASSSQWSPGGISLKNVSLSHNYTNEMFKRIHHNNNNNKNDDNNNSTSECMSLSNFQIQQDLPLQWPYDQSSYDLHEGLHKIKEEIYSTNSNPHQIHQQDMPKFTNMLNIQEITDYTKMDEHKNYNDIVSEKLLLKTISSGFPINGDYSSYPSSSSSLSHSHKGAFSQIHPSVNISSLRESQKMSMETNMRHIPRPFDMNMEMFNGRLLEGNVLNSQEISNLGLIRGSLSPYGLPFHHHLQQTLHQNHSSSLSSPTHQMEMLSNDRGLGEGKRQKLLVATMAGQNVSKKPRVESRSSCPPLKVRKEKLGDRIAALQQLVSPFGKTDTASVLMEAIGYINFLQSQIETLSVPYMRASRNRGGKVSQEGSLLQEGEEEESKDLRSRGLCLVPLSCMTYVTGDGGGLWSATPGFGGET